MNKQTAVVVSDIHSNHLALSAALKLIDEISPDRVIFLGDYVSDCPYPDITVKLVHDCAEKFDCLFIRGNREDYLLRHRQNPDDGWRRSSNTGSLLYTYENLPPSELDFFASMPISADVDIQGCPNLTACHASPSKSKEWIKDNFSLMAKYLREINGELLLCGHTHRYSKITIGRKRVIFCPSVGMPQDKTYGAGMILLESDGTEWKDSFIAVDYDVEAVIAEFFDSGLYEDGGIWSRCVIKSLRTRRDYPMQCVTAAWRIATEEGFHDKILPEIYWERAAKEIGLYD